MKPFRQQPLATLPESPNQPHDWALTTRHDAPHSGPFPTHRVAWRTVGQGPPLLLVHGLMTAGYSFRYLIAPLAQHYTLIIPDLPGAGDTEAPPGPYDAERMADWLAHFLQERGLWGIPALGNSLGGYLAMHLALRHPGALSLLINLHSPGVPLPRLWALSAALALPGAPRLLRALVHRDPEAWVHRNVHYYDESLKSREETRIWAEPLRTNAGVLAFYHWLRDPLDPRALARFARQLRARRDAKLPFPIPLWLIYAETDPVVPPAVGQRLAALLPDATLTHLARASHFAHVDAVPRLLPAIAPALPRLAPAEIVNGAPST